MDFAPIIRAVVASVLFSGVGLLMFGVAWVAINLLSPISIRKELEEDQNIALGVLIGAVMLGLAIIIAAAIHG
jgi:uncharacterized membrane protein YjfL (UPF0719 family)